MANENNTTKPYIVKNADGVEYLLPYYPATFRALLDDKDTIRDLLNSILELDYETVSIWLCRFPILEPKNKYIIVDLVKFLKLRKGVNSREDFWLRLISRGPLEVPESEDPLLKNALDRLRVSNADPELLKKMEQFMFDEMHAYDAVIAENFLKGKTEGKSEGKTEGHADAISVMLAMGLPPEKIAEAKARLEAFKSK